jgi:hypothetical protein
MVKGSVRREVRSFKTTTKELLALSDWLTGEGCTHVALEATGVYWKPVWHVLSDSDDHADHGTAGAAPPQAIRVAHSSPKGDDRMLTRLSAITPRPTQRCIPASPL